MRENGLAIQLAKGALTLKSKKKKPAPNGKIIVEIEESLVDTLERFLKIMSESIDIRVLRMMIFFQPDLPVRILSIAIQQSKDFEWNFLRSTRMTLSEWLKPSIR